MKNKLFKKIMPYLGRDKYVLLLIMLCAGLSAVFAIIGPKVLGDATTILTDMVIHDHDMASSLNKIFTRLFIVGALYIVSFITQIIGDLTAEGVSQRLIITIRKKIGEKMNKIPVSYFESRGTGDVMSLISNDVDLMGSGVGDMIASILNALVTFVGIVVVMFYLNPILALVVLLTIPLRLVYVKFNIKYSKKYYVDQQKHIAMLNSRVQEDFTGFEVIKGFGKEDEAIRNFEKINEDLRVSSKKACFMTSMLNPVMLAIGNLGYIAVLLVGAYLCIGHGMGVGVIQAFINYVNNINAPVQQLSGTANSLQSIYAAMERVFAFLETGEEEKITDPASLGEVMGDVAFNDIYFGYVKNTPIIKGFNLDVKKGQRIAIVGPTGAGKTTLIKLLMRFYDVDAGSIDLDSVDIKTLDRPDLRKHFGMVLQETWLFEGTVMDNIRFGRLDADKEEVIKAAKAAHADSFIELLPGGYDHMLIEDGMNLSAGQRQLLTIARAFLANSPLLILDEATSSVDTRTEVLIQEAMDTLMKGRTSFVIAHRLSTIKNADVILVLKDGNVIETGSHEALMSKKGFYFDLYNAQYA